MSEEPEAPHPHHPPIRVTPDGVEMEPRRVGHHWLDLVLAGSAILISCISLFLAVQHGHTMQQLVAANSWPLLQSSTSNTDDQGRPRITLHIENVGVGPAVLKTFTMTYGGRAYSSFPRLLAACCGWSPPPHRPGNPFEPGNLITGTTA